MFRYSPFSQKSLNTLFKNVVVTGQNKLPLFTLPSVAEKRIWMTEGVELSAVDNNNERIRVLSPSGGVIGVARISPTFRTVERDIGFDNYSKFVEHTGIDCNKIREHIVVDKRFGKTVRNGDKSIAPDLLKMLQKCILLSPRDFREDEKNIHVSKFDVENASDEMKGVVFF